MLIDEGAVSWQVNLLIATIIFHLDSVELKRIHSAVAGVCERVRVIGVDFAGNFIDVGGGVARENSSILNLGRGVQDFGLVSESDRVCWWFGFRAKARN